MGFRQQVRSARLTRQSSKTSRLDFSDEKAKQEAIDLVKALRKMPEELYDKYMAKLPKSDREYYEACMWAVYKIECEQSLEFFAQFVRTKDEHADGSESIRPFPTRIEKPYVWDILDTLCAEQLVVIEKSRQLLVTWTVCVYALWKAKFQKNRLIFIQSKKELDAANLVFNQEWPKARISFIEHHLPDELKSDVSVSYGQLYFRDSGSTVWGIPEGGDQIRSYTASCIISDESAFQPEFEGAVKAAIPSIKGGGQFVAISTARNGAYMKELLRRV
jgi:hypothetical protein